MNDEPEAAPPHPAWPEAWQVPLSAEEQAVLDEYQCAAERGIPGLIEARADGGDSTNQKATGTAQR